MSEHLKKIYVGIECLLDLRLGTLITINPEFAFNVTNKEDYYTRRQDVFSVEENILDKNIYKEVSQAYKQDIIKASIKTKMTVFLREFCSILLAQAINTPYLSGVSVEVNFYPYTLTRQEELVILALVSKDLGDNFNISGVYKSEKELTVGFVKDNYCALVMYDYGNWLNIHNKDLQSKKLKEIALYAPKLNYGRLLTPEEEKEFSDKSTDMYELLKMFLTEFILLQFLPIGLYCADTPMNTTVYNK
jgi:hypothetical protein